MGYCYTRGGDYHAYNDQEAVMITRRVLIIEDSPTDTVLFKEAIDECEMELILSIVPTWHDAQTVLENVRTLSLILLDLNLPGVGGREIISLIRKKGILTPIVVFSTSSSPTDIASCYKEGANSYMVKPYDVDQLFEEMCATFKYWLEINKLKDEVYE